MPPTGHATLGGSNSCRWMNCPGSIRMSRGMPSPSSEYALEGTAAHKLAELCLSRGVDPDTYLYLEVPVEDSDGATRHYPVDEEMVEAVTLFVKTVLAQVEGPQDEMFIEQRFDLAVLNPPAPMFGTSDAVLWQFHKKHLHVFDFKYGAGVAVDATENSQLMMYALGAVVALQKVPEQITNWIVQPRGFHPAGPVRQETFDFAALKAFKANIFAAAHRTQDPDAPLVVGDWCRFCKALPKCPAHRENALVVAANEFDLADVEPALPDPQLLSDEQIRIVLERSSLVMEWLKSVEGYVLQQLQSGVSFPGYKLVEGRSNRQWMDEEKADKYLARRKVKADQRYTKKLISPAQAEKIAKKQGFELPADLITKPEGKPKLAPEADPRPALTAVVEADFEFLPAPADEPAAS